MKWDVILEFISTCISSLSAPSLSDPGSPRQIVSSGEVFKEMKPPLQIHGRIMGTQNLEWDHQAGEIGRVQGT